MKRRSELDGKTAFNTAAGRMGAPAAQKGCSLFARFFSSTTYGGFIMKARYISAVAGLTLAVAGPAFAAGPVALSEVQLDRVVAAGAGDASGAGMSTQSSYSQSGGGDNGGSSPQHCNQGGNGGDDHGGYQHHGNDRGRVTYSRFSYGQAGSGNGNGASGILNILNGNLNGSNIASNNNVGVGVGILGYGTAVAVQK